MAKKEKNKTQYRQSNFFLITVGYMLLVYIYLMVCIYPFIIEPGYAVTSRVKYGFLIAVSYGSGAGPLLIPTFVPLTLLFILIGTILYIRSTGKGVKEFIRTLRFSTTDIMVAAYALFVIISTLTTPYRDDLLWGYTSWYMGFASQFLFIILYFITSRFFDRESLSGLVYASFASSAIVFMIGILQRFGYDILNLYDGLTNKAFISTIGQHTFFSSYMILFFMTGVFTVWISDAKSLMHKAGIVYVVIGSPIVCLCNADMALAGLFMGMSFLFVISFDDIEKMKSFLEITLIILIGWRVTGLLWKIIGPEFKLDTLPVFMILSPYMWIFIAAVAGMYIFVRKKAGERVAFDLTKYRFIGYIYVGLVVAVIIALLVYIILNTMEVLPENLRSDANYLLFNERWGNTRGAIYHDAVLSYIEEFKKSPLTAIFGAGPDQFNHVVEDHVHEWLLKTAGKKVATNAHNEWLTAFINYGLFGGIAYMGIFISYVVSAVKNRMRAPLSIGVAVIVVAYFAHELFCYQQFVNAPYIFLILGIGEQLVRPAQKQYQKNS